MHCFGLSARLSFCCSQVTWVGFYVVGMRHTRGKCFADDFTAAVKLAIQLYYLLGFIIQKDIQSFCNYPFVNNLTDFRAVVG